MSQEEIIAAVVITVALVIGIVWGIVALAQKASRSRGGVPGNGGITGERGSAENATPQAPAAMETPTAPAGAVQPAEPKVRLGEPRQIRLVTPVAPPRPTVRRGVPLRVPVRNEPLWKEKGWRQEGNTYRGQFRVNGRSWPGLIDSPYAGSFQAYIWNPPLPEIGSRTGHRACFRQSTRGGQGCYYVHYHTMPVSLDHAITTIEAVLAEAVGR